MAVYKNQSDMFQKRAQKNKINGDQFYAQAMTAKAIGDAEKYQSYMAQAQTQYQMQKKNEASAKEHSGKNW